MGCIQKMSLRLQPIPVHEKQVFPRDSHQKTVNYNSETTQLD